MGIEGGPSVETPDDTWIRSAEIASETLYPGLLEQLDTLQPEGDRAVIKSMIKAAGIEVVPDGAIAQLWQLSKFDERAHDEMGRLMEEGKCTPDDIAAVFFKMAEVGLL
jgi:hypothetical protein